MRCGLLRPIFPWRSEFVSLSIARLCPAKTANPIEILFWVNALGENVVLNGVPIPPQRGEGDSMRPSPSYIDQLLFSRQTSQLSCYLSKTEWKYGRLQRRQKLLKHLILFRSLNSAITCWVMLRFTGNNCGLSVDSFFSIYRLYTNFISSCSILQKSPTSIHRLLLPQRNRLDNGHMILVFLVSRLN